MSQMSLQDLAAALKPIMPIIKRLATIDEVVSALQSVDQLKAEAARAADKERKAAADAKAESERTVSDAKAEADKAKAQAAASAAKVAEAEAKASYHSAMTAAEAKSWFKIPPSLSLRLNQICTQRGISPFPVVIKNIDKSAVSRRKLS